MKKLWLSMIVFAFLMSGFGMNHWVAAAEYPTKPINCIIPMEPGADGDINMRTIMKKASEFLGQPIVVINKPGAGQTMGYRELYKAKPDGYTIGTCAASLIMAKMQGMYQYDHRRLFAHRFRVSCLADRPGIDGVQDTPFSRSRR